MKQKQKCPFRVVVAIIAFLLLVLAGCGGGGGGDGGNYLSFTTFQGASVVIGQPDFTSNASNQGGAAAANTLSNLYGNPVVDNGILYIPDYGNNRVLGFNTIPAVNGKNADFVLGQSDFATTTANVTVAGMNGPQDVSVDNGWFFVTEYDANRVLIFKTVPTNTGPVPADVVVGQADFVSNVATVSQNGLNAPETSLAVDGKLIVADSLNNRILIWNDISTITNGANADIVLGQANFTDNSPNVTQDTLNYPAGVWSDGTRLVVADALNNRVLIWNTFPTASQTPSDLVLGQADFTSNTLNTPTARTLSSPLGVYCSNNQLFVADTNNNRVLIWNTFPTTNYDVADVVLGQPDFTSNTANNGGLSNKSLNSPTGAYVHGNKLMVADNNNCRYLIYEAI